VARILLNGDALSTRAGIPAGVGWLAAGAVAAVVGINVAGITAITQARRAAREEAAKGLRLQTEAWARSLESALASIRADLAFLTGSPTFFGLEGAMASRDPALARFRRLEAEGALLLFLRAHPEVARLSARSAEDAVLVQAGRRGGVPVLWVASPGAAADPDGAIRGRFAFVSGVRRVLGAVTLEVALEGRRLLPEGSTCRLADAEERVLADDRGDSPAAGSGSAPEVPVARAPVASEGWSAPSPWSLSCRSAAGRTLALVEPVASRYRTVLALNLAVMSLGLVLGAFVLRETRRRQQLEAQAREEARVRELERQLFHAERLSTVGRLAAGMAHEINNPLEGMANYLGLAREDLQRGDPEGARRRLEGLAEGMQRVAAVVGQVLAYADPATAPHEVIDVSQALEQGVTFVRTRREFGEVRFEVGPSAGPLPVRGSQALLGQVFLNLLVNACEAQPRGGEVRVAARREGGRVVVLIADRGPGVPAGDRERIFEPFYTTKRSTGLGLSICHSIVARHGGSLTVEEQPGGGAAFRVSLPAEGDRG
jgi:signal transduction histidine kinase